MPELPHVYVGDEVVLKKAHACGANHWLILRTGADIRLECAGCGHKVRLPRVKLERRVRRFLARGPGALKAQGDAPAEPEEDT